jgi:hypothetical protein
MSVAASTALSEASDPSSLVLVSRDASDIVTVTLNNPKKHNSLNWDMVRNSSLLPSTLTVNLPHFP